MFTRHAALCLGFCSALAACGRHPAPPPGRGRDAGSAPTRIDASRAPSPPPRDALDAAVDDALDAALTDAPTAWRRTGAPPALGALRVAFLRGLGAGGEVLRLERLHPLGDGRFVTIVKTFAPGDEDGHLAYHAALVSTGPAGAQVEATLRLPTTELGDNRDCSDEAVHDLSVRDVDRDGEPEVALMLAYCTPARRALGEVQYRDLMVLDLDPTLRVAAALHLTEAYPSCAARSTWVTHRWRDVDADGHPDLLLSGEICDDGADGGTGDPHCTSGLGEYRHCDATRAELRWSAATDGWPAQLRFVRPRPLGEPVLPGVTP